MKHKVLIVEDNKIVLHSLVNALQKDNYEIATAMDGAVGLELAQQDVFDAVIMDINLPTMDGLEVLAKIRQISIPGGTPPVIILTAHGSVQNAVAAMKAGAADFLIKPHPIKELKAILGNVIAHAQTARKKALAEEQILREPAYRQGRSETSAEPGHHPVGHEAHPHLPAVKSAAAEPVRLVGSSEPIKNLFNLIDKVAVTDSNVFICGETGTGKDLVARLIGQASARKDNPFIKIDCAILPSELLESELFGHEPGAFTGARDRFIGRFEQADGGTVFLDEISNLTLAAQAKLLNVLQDREITRIGGTKKIKINIRLISASNKDLRQLVKDGKFREDLFYRLEVISINIPTLRERADDIPALCQFFLDKFNRINHKHIKGISPRAMELLLNYRWPGNVRELGNLMEQVVVTAETDMIHPKDLPSKITQFLESRPYDRPVGRVPGESKMVNAGEPNVLSLSESKKLSEKDSINQALKQAGGNKKNAAEILGISRVSLYNKIKEHKIQMPSDDV